jgi:hypothetical protein
MLYTPITKLYCQEWCGSVSIPRLDVGESHECGLMPQKPVGRGNSHFLLDNSGMVCGESPW